MKRYYIHVIALAACLLSPFTLAADSDSDGVDDNSDNCTLVANADQRDSNADGYGNACDGDFNDDGIINVVDLGVLRTTFFTSATDTDLNGDGITNTTDLGLFKLMYFNAPGPTGAHPTIPECSCYFSGDCTDGSFCYWGTSGFAVEDDCWWRTPKPQGAVGAGCDTEYEGPAGPICDGHCVEFSEGSMIGHESRALVLQAVDLWAAALIAPSEAGGGPVDEHNANAARALGFERHDSAMEMGRYVADLLSMASEFGFYDYFCHYENHPDEPGAFVDIADDPCRINAAHLAVDALRAELRAAGSGSAHIMAIAKHCPSAVWQGLFAPRCKEGPDALACFAREVRNMGEYLSTPRRAMVESGDDFLRELTSRR